MLVSLLVLTLDRCLLCSGLIFNYLLHTQNHVTDADEHRLRLLGSQHPGTIAAALLFTCFRFSFPSHVFKNSLQLTCLLLLAKLLAATCLLYLGKVALLRKFAFVQGLVDLRWRENRAAGIGRGPPRRFHNHWRAEENVHVMMGWFAMLWDPAFMGLRHGAMGHQEQGRTFWTHRPETHANVLAFSLSRDSLGGKCARFPH